MTIIILIGVVVSLIPLMYLSQCALYTKRTARYLEETNRLLAEIVKQNSGRS